MSSAKGSSSPLMTIKNELLHGAVVKGDLPTARRLLDRHKADINTKNSNGLSMLQIALLNGHSKLSEYLIQKGADIRSTDEEGCNALHDAALKGELGIVRKLISKGLSPVEITCRGELAIDLAANVQVEKMVCEEMFRAGEEKLAKEYSVYLGLGRELTKSLDTRLLAPRGCHSHFSSRSLAQRSPQVHSSSPRLEGKNASAGVKTRFQVSKNVPTHSARVHPSVSNAESAHKVPRPICDEANYLKAELGKGPDCGTGSHDDASGGGAEVLHNSPGPTEVFKEQTTQEHQDKEQLAGSLKDSTEVVNNNNSQLLDIPTHRGNHLPAADQTPNYPTTVKSSGKLVQVPSRESHQGTGGGNSISREAKAIKSLFHHNSFQLQIGLALQSKDTGSSLDDREGEQEDPSDLVTSLPTFSSPTVVTRRQKSLTVPGYSFRTNKSSLHQKRPRSLHKSVSFAGLPMTRSKGMFVGQPATRSSSVPRECCEGDDVATQKVSTSTASPSNSSNSGRSHSTMMDHRLSLPTDIYDHFIKRQESGRKSFKSCDEIDALLDAGIRALSMKPRKSIIVPPKRRTTLANIGRTNSRRRSVTFQPEVLLQEIVTDGDVKAVSEILESGMISDVNKMSPSGLTALHQSAIDGNLECAKALVEKGADVNCTDCEKWTPLHAAVMNGCTEFVRFLLASGANPALKNDAGETAYDMAKSRPIRKMLLHAMNGKSIDANDFSDGEYSGEEEEEYSHAESESDDDTEGDGSGLFDATSEEKKSLKERLGLTHNSALNNSSPSPDLDSVFSPSSQSQVQYSSRDRELTDSTSSYGSLFEPEMEDKKAKQLAKQTGSTKTLESDTDKISESGISTMEGSSDCSHRSRVLSSEDDEISLDSDLDPESFDYKFQEACLYCDVDRLLKLTKHKKEIDIDRVNRTSGITALHHSVLEENFALVQHLVKDFTADVHAIDIDGWTPLHAASAVGNIQIAQFLLEKGAKASCLNNQCELPVDVAEDEAMEKLLKKFMSLKR